VPDQRFGDVGHACAGRESGIRTMAFLGEHVRTSRQPEGLGDHVREPPEVPPAIPRKARQNYSPWERQ